MAVSGAQYWPAKDDDGRTAAAIELIQQVARFADLFTPTDPEYDEPFFWAMENPVGRIPKLLPEFGKPFYFDPHEFAGYLNPSDRNLKFLDKIRKKNGQNVTAVESAFVVNMEAYKKKTGLWGMFNTALVKKPVEPVRCSPQGSFTQRLGGSNKAKAKEERSHTPMGFAQAFYEANHDWTGYVTGQPFQSK
jgi:hypothetical protein